MTVREWFRAMRVAEWDRPNGRIVLASIDQLANTIAEMHRKPMPRYEGNGYWSIDPEAWQRQFEARDRLVYDYVRALFDAGVQGHTALPWHRPPRNWRYLTGITE